MSVIQKLQVKPFLKWAGGKGQLISQIQAFLPQQVLSKLHPVNRHIKDKIRQQLQILRDRKYLSVIEKGRYCIV